MTICVTIPPLRVGGHPTKGGDRPTAALLTAGTYMSAGAV